MSDDKLLSGTGFKMTSSERTRLKGKISLLKRTAYSKNGMRDDFSKTVIFDRLENLMKYYKDQPFKALCPNSGVDDFDVQIEWWKTVIKKWSYTEVCTKAALIRLFEATINNLYKEL